MTKLDISTSILSNDFSSEQSFEHFKKTPGTISKKRSNRKNNHYRSEPRSVNYSIEFQKKIYSPGEKNIKEVSPRLGLKTSDNQGRTRQQD